MRKCGQIYTDAGLIPRLGVSAWAAILVKGIDWDEIGGTLPLGLSSGAAEILAATEALNYVADRPHLFYPDCWLFTDAQPIAVALAGELPRWQERNWHSRTGRRLKAAEQWKQFAIAVERVEQVGIQLHGCFVPAHQDKPALPWNGMADTLVKRYLGTAAKEFERGHRYA